MLLIVYFFTFLFMKVRFTFKTPFYFFTFLLFYSKIYTPNLSNPTHLFLPSVLAKCSAGCSENILLN